MQNLSAKRVAILAARGFEQGELERAQHMLTEVGASAELVSPEKAISRVAANACARCHERPAGRLDGAQQLL